MWGYGFVFFSPGKSEDVFYDFSNKRGIYSKLQDTAGRDD